jgi:hypothetical protein
VGLRMKNPYADGKIRGRVDAIVRGTVLAVAAFVAVIAPYAWYWRIAIFIGIMFVVGMIYPTVQNAWANRRRSEALIRKAWEDSGKPRGPYKAAIAGAEIRRQFFALVEEVEASLGVHAVAIASAEGVLMVHPKLSEEIRKQPNADVLEIAFTHCFLTKDARRRVTEAWPSRVAHYQGKSNSEAVLREKSALLATYVVSNLDAAEMAEGEASEKVCIVQIEEAAVWYRVLDELVFQFLREQRDIFMDFLQDDLASCLALMGSPPDLINETMAGRSREYANYREWVPAENAGAKGTLLWEAAKHVGEPIGLNINPVFLLQFGTRLLEKLNRASVHELLVGKERARADK